MGILDHQRTWQFNVAATPDACKAAFAEALSRPAVMGILKCAWKLDTTTTDGQPQVRATYQGRTGLAEFLSSLSKHSDAEMRAAVGSELFFAAHGGDHATECEMWLALVTTRIGFTADARFLRAYMRSVETHLRRIDPNLATTKL